jgi:hypothetical protein
MNEQRRQELIDKFPAINWPPMNPALNTTVQGVLRAERIEDLLADDSLLNALLCDPAWSPTLYAKLVDEREALHALEHEDGGAVYKTFRGEAYNPHAPADTSGTALLKYPGDRRIFVCRNNADRMAAFVESQGPWGVCDVCIAEDCQSVAFNDYPTRPLPMSCGRVALMFEICAACEFVATDVVEDRMRSAVTRVQATLPEGTRIDPGSPVPPLP